jgi:oligopeptide/dipeptide ABC transporter ATP-binding protein
MNALELRGLSVSLDTRHGRAVVIENTSFAIARGETLALVGESGAGKTMTALAILGLVPPGGQIDTGQVLVGGRSVFELSAEELRSMRGREVAMIFQDPTAALNPFLTIGEQLDELLRAHGRFPRRERRRRCAAALGDVGLPTPERLLACYPHELSGGMRQRAMIAMALLLEPAVLIADEPTAALDVTVQAQVLELLRDLQRRRGTAILLITHDFGVVAGLARHVAVMYAGALIEIGSAEELFREPHHPYTFALLQSIPNPATPADQPLPTIPGQPPDLLLRGAGCAFAPRCPFKIERCKRERPQLEPSGGIEPEALRAARLLLLERRRAACFEHERVASLTGLWSQSLAWGRLEQGQAAARLDELAAAPPLWPAPVLPEPSPPDPSAGMDPLA